MRASYGITSALAIRSVSERLAADLGRDGTEQAEHEPAHRTFSNAT